MPIHADHMRDLNPPSQTDAELFAELVQQYAATCRHPDLPPFAIRQHDATSIHDSVRYPEVLRPGVYARYDHTGALCNIGQTDTPSVRLRQHHRDALYINCRPSPRIDLVTVSESWEIFSLEKFLHAKFPDYGALWHAWVERERQHHLSQTATGG